MNLLFWDAEKTGKDWVIDDLFTVTLLGLRPLDSISVRFFSPSLYLHLSTVLSSHYWIILISFCLLSLGSCQVLLLYTPASWKSRFLPHLQNWRIGPCPIYNPSKWIKFLYRTSLSLLQINMVYCLMTLFRCLFHWSCCSSGVISLVVLHMLLNPHFQAKVKVN